MNCPVCDGVRMREVEKEGVMIDICEEVPSIFLTIYSKAALPSAVNS